MHVYVYEIMWKPTTTNHKKKMLHRKTDWETHWVDHSKNVHERLNVTGSWWNNQPPPQRWNITVACLFNIAKLELCFLIRHVCRGETTPQSISSCSHLDVYSCLVTIWLMWAVENKLVVNVSSSDDLADLEQNLWEVSNQSPSYVSFVVNRATT